MRRVLIPLVLGFALAAAPQDLPGQRGNGNGGGKENQRSERQQERRGEARQQTRRAEARQQARRSEARQQTRRAEARQQARRSEARQQTRRAEARQQERRAEARQQARRAEARQQARRAEARRERPTVVQRATDRARSEVRRTTVSNRERELRERRLAEARRAAVRTEARRAEARRDARRQAERRVERLVETRREARREAERRAARRAAIRWEERQRYYERLRYQRRVNDRYARYARYDRYGRVYDSGRNGYGPAFCRSGQGHPVYGRQWCLDKGFGLGRSYGTWQRAWWDDARFRYDRYDRYDRYGRRDLGRDLLLAVLGDALLGRLTYGVSEPVYGRWTSYSYGGPAVMYLYSGNGSYPLAELTDYDRDGRVDLVLVNSGRY